MSVEPRTSVRSRAFCAAVSSANAEPLAATASRIDNWILLEYRGLWDRDVLGGSLLSDEAEGPSPREQLHAARALAPALPEEARAPVVRPPPASTSGRRGLAGALLRARGRPPGRPAGASTSPGRWRATERAGRPARPPAPRRLHARQARPLLRQERAPGLRRAAARDEVGPRLAVDPRRRRSLRRERRRLPAGALLRPGRAGGRRRPAGRPRAGTDRARALPRPRRLHLPGPGRGARRSARSEGLLGIDDLALARLPLRAARTPGASASAGRRLPSSRSTSPPSSRRSRSSSRARPPRPISASGRAAHLGALAKRSCAAGPPTTSDVPPNPPS